MIKKPDREEYRHSVSAVLKEQVAPKPRQSSTDTHSADGETDPAVQQHHGQYGQTTEQIHRLKTRRHRRDLISLHPRHGLIESGFDRIRSKDHQLVPQRRVLGGARLMAAGSAPKLPRFPRTFDPQSGP